MHNAFLTKAKQLKDANEAYATAHIVRRKIPSSGKPGDKAIITKDGAIHGWIGGGCTRGIVLKEALEAIQENKPRLVSISPSLEKGGFEGTKTYRMTCQSGGEVDVYIEPVLPNPQLMVFSSSHIAMALAKIAKAMDYQVDVVMTEPDSSLFPTVDSLTSLAELNVENVSVNAHIVVCTQGERDLQSLYEAIQAKSRYLAFVSSRKKANGIFIDLKRQGVSFDELAKIKTPAGLDIGAKTPEEVAISILAEIIQLYRKEKEEDQKPVDLGAAMSDAYYINPVCNIPVQKSTAKHVLEYNGDKVYFCCDGCKLSFEQEPEKYMQPVG